MNKVHATDMLIWITIIWLCNEDSLVLVNINEVFRDKGASCLQLKQFGKMCMYR